ncbi:uncharacterized protein TM35_000451280 [Trypanosoma theileri]|uniref:Complement component 3 CUB domain-containing protein n=1 Tax=Trypanosoma theileri TaxID=67003 RepID=A0A1X0NJW0_9TRYP|nr:uncharacterized protein TM35_000451280 [Trypanosoma theileri]ORC84390.1 hypothetical protein TM35_000451280 [Trypanosoma theileri]
MVIMMRHVLCILALLLSCACVHVLAEEVPAADLSDQVPDTESETKILLQGTPVPGVVGSEPRGGSQGEPGGAGRNGELGAPSAVSSSGQQPAVETASQQSPVLQQQGQQGHNRGDTDNGSVPAESEGRGNTPTTAGNEDLQEPQKTATEGQETEPTADTTSSGDGGSNTTNPQTQSENAIEGGDSNTSNQTAAATGTTGTEGSQENVNADSTTTTTTTTTTLPPETANNKKVDADSSSSISNSVWVRVPLLIVVTLSCILVC